MIRLSACIEMVYADLPFDDRIRKAAEMGLPAIEFWGWTNKDIPRIAQLTGELGLEVAAFSGGSATLGPQIAERGGWLGGQCASLCAQVMKECAAVAKQLGNPVVIMTSGNEKPDVPREQQHDALVECLRAAAPVLEGEGVTLVLEPLNPHVDHQGIYLTHSSEGFQIVDEVASPNVKLLYDIYHQQITEGNLIATITANIDKIGHFHTGDVPGRIQPGTGEINYPNVLKAIAQTGYAGYVGMEFRLTKPPEEALAHMIDAAKNA